MNKFYKCDKYNKKEGFTPSMLALFNFNHLFSQNFY